jgi:hypothetical protein
MMLGGISLWLTHNLIDIDGQKKLHKPKKRRERKQATGIIEKNSVQIK